MSRRVGITAVGAVTPAGIGFEALRSALRNGKSLAAEISAFEAASFPTTRAAQVTQTDPKAWIARRKDIKLLSRDSLLAVGAARDAIASAGPDALADPFDVGLFLGVGLEEGDPAELARTLSVSLSDGRVNTEALGSEGMDQMNPLASLKTLPNMALGHVAIQCGIKGPNLALSAFDYAGLQALDEAARAIRDGQVDVALAGATDAKVSVFGLTTFSRLGYLAQEASAPPFDARRTGALPGEGAVMFVLETFERARKRGVPILAEVLQMAQQADPEPVSVPETSAGFACVMEQAVSESGVGRPEVGAVFAAGGGTSEGDRVEALAIARTLASPYVASVKHVVGDAFAASACMNVAGAVAALVGGDVFGPADFETDASCPIRAAEPGGSEIQGDVVLVNAGSLGGCYASLALRRVP